jgi:hypothetical protein
MFGREYACGQTQVVKFVKMTIKKSIIAKVVFLIYGGYYGLTGVNH